MPFLVETQISKVHDAVRNATRASHVAYLEANAAAILAAGAKLDDAGAVGDGTFYLLDVETRADAERFIAADPYAVNGVIDSMTIHRVRTAFLNRERQQPA